MALMRSWTDPRDGKLWVLRHGLMPKSPVLVFTRGAEKRIVMPGCQRELDNFTDEELEALLDQALRVQERDA